MGEINEGELCLQALDGSASAFRTLYNRYSGPLFRFIYRFTANETLAEDILHDVFVEFLAGKFKMSGEGTLKSWFYTLAKNKSLNHLKRATKEVVDNSLMQSIRSKIDLESEAIENNLLKTLSVAVTSLPQDLQQTWNLKKQGLDHRQIAQSLAIPVGTVKSRCHRIVEILRKEFGSNEL
jgi:RNA polymerase sigma-70 factor (ECF subfamily)